MKLIIYVLILIYPLTCISQSMDISRKGEVTDNYPLSDIKKITFTDCATGINEHLLIKTFNQLKSYPNPFSDITTIELNLQQTCNTSVTIYNSQGILMRNLYNASLGSGIHKITWDGRNNAGSIVTNGLYFYQVILNGQVYSNKMFLIK